MFGCGAASGRPSLARHTAWARACPEPGAGGQERAECTMCGDAQTHAAADGGASRPTDRQSETDRQTDRQTDGRCVPVAATMLGMGWARGERRARARQAVPSGPPRTDVGSAGHPSPATTLRSRIARAAIASSHLACAAPAEPSRNAPCGHRPRAARVAPTDLVCARTGLPACASVAPTRPVPAANRLSPPEPACAPHPGCMPSHPHLRPSPLAALCMHPGIPLRPRT